MKVYKQPNITSMDKTRGREDPDIAPLATAKVAAAIATGVLAGLAARVDYAAARPSLPKISEIKKD